MTSGIAAIILAAGYASRMGRVKPLLPLGEGIVIEQVVHAFRAAGVADVVVVLGHRSNDFIPELQRFEVPWQINEHYAQGMLSSVKKGVASLEGRPRAFFMMPADIPLVRPSTLKGLIDLHASHPRQAIYPSFQGHRGHPPLIPAHYREAILAYEGQGGLRRCLEKWDQQALDCAVADQGVLMDMDTPDDYETILKKYKRLDTPSPKEALALLAIHQHGRPQVMEHSLRVGAVAAVIGQALEQAGRTVDVQLIEAAGILHDVARGQPDHARRGAQLIADNGFQAAAEIAGRHMDLVFDPSRGAREQEVVFLADKMVDGSELISLEKRLHLQQERFANDPEACRRMTARMEQARRIRSCIEKIIGEPLERLLRANP